MNRSRTLAARAGVNCSGDNRDVVAPISVSCTFARTSPDSAGPYDYARTKAPGNQELGRALAALDGAAGAIITASGMAAIDLVLNLVPNGARLVCAHDCYGGTARLMNARAAQRGFDLTYVDCSDLSALEAALNPGADFVFLETPSNPRLRLTDLERAIALAHKAGARVAVDNTVLSPVHQRPLDFGADFTLYSVTKILNGHSDMIGGAVCAAQPDAVETLGWWANASGVTGGAFDAFLALRGLRTLPLRARAQSESALALAEKLAAHPLIRRVDYPGLETHPGHALARAQQSGFGCLLSFELEDGLPAARRLIETLELFTLAQSLGGAESLISIPATMTHAAMSADARARAGISDGLVRVSVGLEDPDELWADLQVGLAKLNANRG